MRCKVKLIFDVETNSTNEAETRLVEASQLIEDTLVEVFEGNYLGDLTYLAGESDVVYQDTD